jgi:quercetin dioxygenase-like cupin family protein
MQVVDPSKANVRGWPVRISPRVVAGDAVAPGGGPGTLGSHTGFEPLAQAVLALEPGQRHSDSSGADEVVIFVLEGRGTLTLDAAEHELEPECGAYLAPGESYELVADEAEPLNFIRVAIPEPEPESKATGERQVVRRLADQESQDATTDREFRIVADPSSGLRSATHFVGYIPTAKAPEHFHTYDEVIYVIDGEGVFHAGDVHEQLRPGSCIQLPARTVHCLENTGSETMRVAAVFRPAGSPAAAYYPDGTPAYTTDSKRP